MLAVDAYRTRMVYSRERVSGDGGASGAAVTVSCFPAGYQRAQHCSYSHPGGICVDNLPGIGWNGVACSSSARHSVRAMWRERHGGAFGALWTQEATRGVVADRWRRDPFFIGSGGAPALSLRFGGRPQATRLTGIYVAA